MIFEPVHGISNNVVCAPSKASDRAYAQSDQSLCLSLDYSMIIKLLTEHHLEFLSLKRGCRGSSESTHVKLPHCWKPGVMAHIYPSGDYIDDYTESPGTIMATSADFSFYPVVSSSDCAKQCSQDDTLHCRAFQFCDSTKECFLFRIRAVGMPKPRGVTSCSFFTSKNTRTLTHLSQMECPALINWTSAFPFLGVLCGIFSFLFKF